MLRRLSRAAWGHGYASEAASAALADGFGRCGFERVIATVQAPNLASAGAHFKQAIPDTLRSSPVL